MSTQTYDTPKYYMPYDSENDTDKDTVDDYETDNDTGDEYDSSDLPEHEDARIRREQDPRYAIIRSIGPSFSTSKQQLQYMENAPGAEYDDTSNISTLNNLVYLNPPKTTVTSLFSVKSSNRDRRVYPTPFNYEIKLPRVYKNVTKFQLVQLSFPNNTIDALVTSEKFTSTFVEVLLAEGVPQECLSTCVNLIGAGTISNTIGVVEEGRINENNEPLMTTLSIPDGIYTNEEIVGELNKQSKNTPPFNIISYTDFERIFKATCNPSVLFNEPGDLYFSKLTGNNVYSNFTKETIMNTYYTQKHIDSLSSISDIIVFNAYYYPVLKELLITDKSLPFLSLGTYTYSTIYDLVINKFEGLDSTDYYTICSTNQTLLDAYRRNHTFELNPVNNYQWIYDSKLKQYKIIYDTLHTSIRRDIDNKYTTIFNNELTIAGLSPTLFTTLKGQKTTNNVIVQSLISYLSTKIGEYYFEENYQYLGGVNHISVDNTNSTIIRTSTDLHNDSMFTTLFNFSSIFGNEYHIIPGIELSFTNFLDYHSTLSSYYNISQSTTNTISGIYSSIHNKHTAYVSSKYTNIFPSSYIQNASYNDNRSVPVMFLGNNYLYAPGLIVSNNEDCTSICSRVIEKIIVGWYSCLPVNSVVNSLQYRLGLINLPIADFSIVSTITEASQTNTNYLLEINNDRSFNNMDIAMNENYSITNETTGQVKLIYAKILTGGLGSGEISQTVIQNPIMFDNPLGKLDKLQFKIYYDDDNLTPSWLAVPFDIGFNEWDATFQIDEEVGYANKDSGWGINPTVPIPSNPSALQYMALSAANNPNNK